MFLDVRKGGGGGWKGFVMGFNPMKQGRTKKKPERGKGGTRSRFGLKELFGGSQADRKEKTKRPAE